MPVMIWVAIIIELVKGILTGEGWEDFAVLMVLQFANAIVGFVEENNAGNAIDVRKSICTRKRLTRHVCNAIPPSHVSTRSSRFCRR